MECRILIVSTDRSIIVDSLTNDLTKAEVRAITCKPDVREIEVKRESMDIALLFIEELSPDIIKALVYIKDICVDDDKPLYLVGYKDALDRVQEFIPSECVKKEYPRPVDTKKILVELLEEADMLKFRDTQKKILIVDDDVTFLKMVRKWLSWKYHVTTVKSGMQAIRHLASHTPDLILMDYDMPVTNGSKLTEMIRSEPETEAIPIIFLTGKADRETVYNVMGLNPQGYLLKSMNQSDLTSAIDKYFESERLQQKNAAGFLWRN